MTSMHQHPKRTFSQPLLAEVVALDCYQRFSSFLVEETGRGHELNSYKFWTGGSDDLRDHVWQGEFPIRVYIGWCCIPNTGSTELLDAAEELLRCSWSCSVDINKQNVCASLMEDSRFLAYVVKALIKCKLLRNDGKVEELTGFNLIKLEERLLMELMENYADSRGTNKNNKKHLFNQKYEDGNTLFHLTTTFNKSIKLTSMMAEEIEQVVRLVKCVSKEVKKLTNKLQAIPVVLVDPEQRQVKTVNNFLAEPPDSSEAMAHAMEAGEFSAVNVPSVVLQPRSSFLANSHLKNTWPIGTKIESGTNVHHLLLLIAALLSAITFYIALKIQVCISEQGYNYNSSLIPICHIVDQHPLFIQLVMAFNSIAFYLSVAFLMILFNELPLRPLLLVSAFSMLGAYNCIISDPAKST